MMMVGRVGGNMIQYLAVGGPTWLWSPCLVWLTPLGPETACTISVSRNYSDYYHANNIKGDPDKIIIYFILAEYEILKLMMQFCLNICYQMRMGNVRRLLTMILIIATIHSVKSNIEFIKIAVPVHPQVRGTSKSLIVLLQYVSG